MPLVIAHRGDSAREQENSLAAVRAAVEAGADMVEVDVRRTADGVFVCAHDPDLSRLADVPRAIGDMTLADVQAAACRADADVPRLADVLGAARFRTSTGGGVQVLLDIKPELSPDQVRRLAEIVWASEMGKTAVFGLRRPSLVTDVRSVLPEARLLAFYGSEVDLSAFVDAGVEAIRVWEGDRSSIEAMLNRETPSWVTVGGPGTDRAVGAIGAETVSEMVRAGAAGLIIDDPTAVSRALRDIVKTG